MEAGGQKEKKKEKPFVCIYLDVDKGKRREKNTGESRREGKTEKRSFCWC